MKREIEKYNVINKNIQPYEGKYSFGDLVRVIAHLRSENGCPWDKVQTHSSLRGCIIEEAYEVVEAINQFEENGDYENLCEELGDIMLQSVTHSQIAYEEKLFTMADVIDRVTDKMITRHSHVFGNINAENAQEALLNWEEMKREEKRKIEEKSNCTVKKSQNEMQKVPKAFPALIRAQKVLKKADKVYLISKKKNEIIDNIKEIIFSFENNNFNSKELIGQLLMETVDFARINGIDAESCLREHVDKYIEINSKNI